MVYKPTNITGGPHPAGPLPGPRRRSRAEVSFFAEPKSWRLGWSDSLLWKIGMNRVFTIWLFKIAMENHHF